MITKKFVDCSEKEQWMFCEMLGALQQTNIDEASKFENIYKKDKEGTLTIEFKLNGVEMDFFAATTEMFRQFDRIVKDEALTFVTKQLEILENITEVYENKMKELYENVRSQICKDLNIQYKAQWDL